MFYQFDLNNVLWFYQFK